MMTIAKYPCSTLYYVAFTRGRPEKFFVTVGDCPNGTFYRNSAVRTAGVYVSSQSNGNSDSVDREAVCAAIDVQ